MLPLNKDYQIIDKLDFRNNRLDLVVSYFLRIIGLFVFGAIFYWVYTNQIGDVPFLTLLNIEINNVSPIISIALLMIDIVFILYLHEMIHATVFYFIHKQKPQIGIRGFVIFAAAPEQILSKREVIVNAIAPLIVITVIGLMMLSQVSISSASWIFLPILINAAASGGDLMTVYFVLKQKEKTLFNDIGDIIYAVEFNSKRKGEK